MGIFIIWWASQKLNTRKILHHVWNIFTKCSCISLMLLSFKMKGRDSKVFTSLWVLGTHGPRSIWLPNHWEWVPSLMFFSWKILRYIPRTQVASSWWVPFEFWWEYETGRGDIRISGKVPQQIKYADFMVLTENLQASWYARLQLRRQFNF